MLFDPVGLVAGELLDEVAVLGAEDVPLLSFVTGVLADVTGGLEFGVLEAGGGVLLVDFAGPDCDGGVAAGDGCEVDEWLSLCVVA